MEEYKALSRIIYGGIYRGIGLVFALLLGVYFVYEIWTIVLVLLLALLFAIVLSGPVNYLARRGLPKVLSVLSVLGGLVLALWLASVAVIPVIQKQAEQFTRDLPTLLAQVQDLTINGVGISPQSVLEEGQDYLSSHVTLSSVLDVSRSITEAVSLSLPSSIHSNRLSSHTPYSTNRWLRLALSSRAKGKGSRRTRQDVSRCSEMVSRAAKRDGNHRSAHRTRPFYNRATVRVAHWGF